MSVKEDNNIGQEEETVESLKAKLAETESKLGNATNELIEGRNVRAALEGERDALKFKLEEVTKTPKEGDQPSPEDAVRKVLKERDDQDASKNRQAAELAFIAKHKEFSTDNDPGGIKFAAIKAKFARFNTDGIVKTEDFLSLYEEAFILANPSKPDSTHTVTPYAATPPRSSTGPREGNDNQLSSTEKTIIDRMGWTEERYLALKTKRPAYVASLLRSLA